MITAFVNLLWVNWTYGYQVFIEKSTKQFLSKIFVGQIENMNTLEDAICDYKQFGFERIKDDIASLDEERFKVGRALALSVDIDNPNGCGTRCGWWKFYRIYRKRTISNLPFKQEIVTHVETTIRKVLSQVLIVGCL